MKGFDVTYDVVTPESAEYGDVEECGFVATNLSLTEALRAMGNTEDAVDANDSRRECARWITAYRVEEDFRTGAIESRSIHFPDNLTPSTRARICRLVMAGNHRAY